MHICKDARCKEKNGFRKGKCCNDIFIIKPIVEMRRDYNLLLLLLMLKKSLILEELKIYNINNKVKENRDKWKSLLERMNSTRLKKVLKYSPRRERNIGRSRKRWWDV